MDAFTVAAISDIEVPEDFESGGGSSTGVYCVVA